MRVDAARQWTMFFFISAVLAAPVAANDWHVDAHEGRDANAGTRTAPFQTLSQAVRKAQGGDTILLMPGVYDGIIERMNPGKHLFENDYVTIRPAEGDGEAARDNVKIGRIQLGVRGSNFAGPDGMGVFDAYLRLQNVTLTDGVYAFGARHLEVVDCRIERIGLWAGDNEAIHKTAVQLGGGSYHRVQGCDITNTGIGVSLSGRHQQVIGCRIHDITHDGIRVVSGRHILIEGNDIYHLDDGVNDGDEAGKGWNKHCDGIHIFIPGPGRDGSECVDIVVRGNRIFACESQGLIISPYLRRPELFSRDIVIENNIFGPSSGWAINVPGGVDGLTIRHNSFVNLPDGLTFQTRFRELHGDNTSVRVTPKCRNVRIYNNILTQQLGSAAGLQDWYVGHNVLTAIRKNQFLRRTDRLAAETPFVDPHALDGRLKPDSLAVDAGTRQAPSIEPLETDRAGASRDARPDAGAMEIAGRSPQPEPPFAVASGPVTTFVDDFSDGDLSVDPTLTGTNTMGLAWRPAEGFAPWNVSLVTGDHQPGLSMPRGKGMKMTLTEQGEDWTDLAVTVRFLNRYNNAGGGLLLRANGRGEGYMVDLVAGTIAVRQIGADGEERLTPLASTSPLLGRTQEAQVAVTIRDTSRGVVIAVDQNNDGSVELRALDDKRHFKQGRIGVFTESANGSHRTDVASVEVTLQP